MKLTKLFLATLSMINVLVHWQWADEHYCLLEMSVFCK